VANYNNGGETISFDLGCADLSTRHLIRRAAPLTFGIFGTIGARSVGVEERDVREGGSGIFVAPFLAITARHVSDDLYRLENREPPRRPHQSQFSAYLFQVLDPPNVSATSLWHVDRSVRSPHTDITLLQASAASEVAQKQLEMQSTFFEWRLTPLPRGSPCKA
jgi:hypothetical protein